MSGLPDNNAALEQRFYISGKPKLMNDHTCGCFFCLNIFSPKQIERWTEDAWCAAICPYCGACTVLGKSAGNYRHPITKDFLTQIHQLFFGSGAESELDTPYGKVKVLLDGESTIFQKICIGPGKPYHCPDVDGAYHITVDVEPDGKNHILEFLLIGCEAEGSPEGGERLEAVSIYPGNGKITLGCYGSFGEDPDYDCDFDGTFRADGIEVWIGPKTKTKRFFFGVSWIEHCTEENDVQTWFGADPFCEAPWPI